MNHTSVDMETYEKMDQLVRIGNRAVRKAQEESRQLGVPNVYSINGIIYYEQPNGELSRSDPYASEKTTKALDADVVACHELRM